MAAARGKASMAERETPRKKQRTVADNKPSRRTSSKSREDDGMSFDDFLQKVKRHVSEDEARSIAEANGQEVDSGHVLEHCADQMLYGPLENCPDCGGSLQFTVHEYKCTGFVSEWSKCDFSTKEPSRKKEPLQMPKHLKNDFIAEWKKEHDPKGRPERDTEESNEDSNEESNKPFSGMHIILAGRLRKSQYKWRQEIEKLGGKVVHVIKEGVSCLVVPERDLSSGVYAKIGEARSKHVPVVKEPWLQDCMTKQEVQSFDRYAFESQKSDDTANKENSAPDMQPPEVEDEEDAARLLMAELKLAGKRGVHKDSQLDQEGGRIFEHEGIIYNCAFALCDQGAGLNICATHQLVELPNGSLYLYYKKGRISDGARTNERLDEQSSLNKAINQFAKLFEELTGNEFEPWERQKKFTKKRSKLYPLDMADGVDARAGGLRDQQLGVASVHTKLDPKVARVCKLLFSQSVYRQAMFEMGVDSPDLPAGILTDFHIKRCEECLLEFAEFLEKGEANDKKHEKICVDYSNRWYSLLPSTRPIVINDIVQLAEQAASTLESVRDISVASQIIGDMTGDTLDDPLSDRYAKMNCKLTPVDKDSDDYKMVQKYLDKTYEPVKYDDVTVGVVMEELFTVESKAGPSLEEIEKLPNKVLIWCGTRTSNLVRCLSKGMAPSVFHAPAPGYMFGRGLYCTDASGKAAQYGFTGVDRPEGFLMLSIVALGEKVLELTKPTEDVSKYEKEKVAIKGLGKKMPDESEYFTWRSNVTVPCGTLKPSGHDDSPLDYNEYVVYDPKQVKLHYIVQVRYEDIS